MIQRGRAKHGPKSSGLIITSLIDYFTIVVIYLMKSYSADGNILTNADNLVLPNSNATNRVKEVNIQIAASNDYIMVDNIPIVPTSDVRKIPSTDPDPVIKKLEDKLKIAYKQEEQMVKLGALNNLKGSVVIQIDKNVEFDVLFKIMNTCGKVGYNNMNFAVLSREN